MTNNIQILTTILYIMLGIMFALLTALLFVYINIQIKKRQSEAKANQEENQVTPKTKSKSFTIDSVFNFMEFDKVEDNMIIQKNGTRFIMVVECQGINYDLMSQAEKVAVEEGFVQFLNTLSHPVQIYTQTRKINLESSLLTYKNEVAKLEQEFSRQRTRYQSVISSQNATAEQKKQALYEFTKQKNLYEYGKDIIFNTEKMSLNKNILNKKYYIVIPYFPEEAGQGNYDKSEIRELAFSELYTRAQAIIRTLSVSGVIGRVLTSTELVDLLYVAYNRDEAETYGVDKAIKAGYDELYSTAPDYMDKKMEIIDAQILRDAMELANNKVIEAQTEKQKEYEKKVASRDDIINNLAQLIIQENEAMLGRDITAKAKEKVRKERKNNVQEETDKSRVSNEK